MKRNSLYLRVGRRSVLHVELQSLQSLLLLDEVCGVQSHVLVEDLEVLAGKVRRITSTDVLTTVMVSDDDMQIHGASNNMLCVLGMQQKLIKAFKTLTIRGGIRFRKDHS